MTSIEKQPVAHVAQAQEAITTVADLTPNVPPLLSPIQRIEQWLIESQNHALFRMNTSEGDEFDGWCQEFTECVHALSKACEFQRYGRG